MTTSHTSTAYGALLTSANHPRQGNSLPTTQTPDGGQPSRAVDLQSVGDESVSYASHHLLTPHPEFDKLAAGKPVS